MSMIRLARGANSLIACPPGESLTLTLAYEQSADDHDVDLFVAVVGRDGRVRSNDDLLFYNQPALPEVSGRFLGSSIDRRRRTQTVRLSVDSLAGTERSVVVAAASDDGKALAGTTGLVLTLSTQADSVEMPAEADGPESATIAAEIYQRNGDWKVRSVWQGWREGLPSLLESLGADVADEGEEAAALPQESSASTIELERLDHQIRERRLQLEALERQIVETREIAFLQDVGIYEFAHPLDTAPQYKERLDALKSRYKELAKGKAVTGATNWAVNGSLQEGAKMVREQCKLMLRAYNAEADNCIRTVRSHNLDAVRERLERAKASIEKLGKSMAISITDDYHICRLEELRLTADYQLKLSQERERIRAEREEQREQERAERELAEARAAFERERDKLQAALDIALRQGDETAVTEMRGKLEDAVVALEDIERRQANFRAGYVYVISNLGAFGDRIVKIGMTRRLEPTERIKELSGAGVPFLYDIHALFFSDDALGLESQLHKEFEHRRVNRINLRREFFYATPHEVLDAVRQLAGETVLEFTEEAEADEFRRSLAMGRGK